MQYFIQIIELTLSRNLGIQLTNMRYGMAIFMKEAGFTLIEMMVTLVIMAIILSIALPSVQRQIASAQIKSAATSIDSALKQARAEALVSRKNTQTTLTDTNLTAVRQTANIFNGVQATPTLEATPFTSQSFGQDIVITQLDNLPRDIVFTPNKRATNTNGEPLVSGGYKVCFRGSSVPSYIVRVDALTNINLVPGGTDAQGACS